MSPIKPFVFLYMALVVSGCTSSGTESGTAAPQPSREEVERAQGEENNLQIPHADLEKHLDDLRGTLDAAKNKVLELQEALAREHNRAQRAEAGLLMLEQRSQTLGNETNALKLQNALLAAETARLDSALREFENPTAGHIDEQRQPSLLAENVQLKQELEKLKKRHKVTTRERRLLSQELSKAAESLGQAKAHAAELNKTYRTLSTAKAGAAPLDKARQIAAAAIHKEFEETQAEVARLSGAKGIYTVRGGDTLSSIAIAFYRDSHRWSAIYRANAYLLEHPDRLYTGMVLVIPY